MKTNSTTYGTIRIVTSDDVEYQMARTVPGEVTIDLSDAKNPEIHAELEPPGIPQVVKNGDEPPSTALHSKGPSELSQEADAAASRRQPPATGQLVALGATGIALAGVALAAIVGPSVWDPDQSQLGAVGVHAYRLVLFLVSTIGTMWLWEDARVLEATDARWQPDPTHYMATGAAVIALVGGAWFLAAGVPVTSVLVGSVGLFLVGLLVSSIVVAPVYVLNRHRKLDRAPASEEG